jgi:GNAT superfamily N-acetyltransferase
MPRIDIHPLTVDSWPDFETLFGSSGAYGGCWCTWWRQTRTTYSENGNAGNKQLAQSLVEDGCVVGLLGYFDGVPAAWVSIAPRTNFPSLDRSPVLKRLDDQPVWSLVCLYVGKNFRGDGLALAMIKGAIDYAAANGARIIEAYPSVPKGDEPLPPVSSFMGTPGMFEAAGFEQVARPSRAKAIYRFTVPL